MSSQQRTSTTRLPAVLREQIEKEGRHGTRKRRKQVTNRKEARKQGRQQEKQRRAEFFSHGKPKDLLLSRKRPTDGNPKDEPVQKKLRLAPAPVETLQSKNISTKANSPRTQPNLKSQPSRTTSQPTPKSSERKLPGPIETKNQSHEEDIEDARIAWLESKLRVAKDKSRKAKSTFFGDGLDDLLNDLDRIVPVNTQPWGGASESGDEDSEPSEFKGSSSADVYEENSDADACHIMDVVPISDTTSVDNLMAAPSEVNTSEPSVQPRSRYIPPQRRRTDANDESEALLKLSRRIKGLLNRLSEQNIGSILQSIEDLYHNHRRHDITSSLTILIIDGVSSHSSHLDSFVVLHASLVASLHKIIGVDFAAHLVQALISSYEGHYQTMKDEAVLNSTDENHKGKECLNLAVLLSELYNCQVISCVLVYDVIRCLLDTLGEFDVELLLKIVRNSGQQLRQDDPSALKDIIQAVQLKMSEKEQATISSRTHFMIETLTNLKNNKIKRIVGQGGYSESAERMKKFLSGLSKKYHVVAHEPLRVSLSDLHSSEKKGKWWLVGSAWGGDPLLDRTHTNDQQPVSKGQAERAADSLLKLARKQGMNTDVRRSIFAVLMSSDDYVDACDRLSQLNLNETQQREIVRVILHCLGNEKQYNPYYTLVMQQLCHTSHSYKVTLQFCLWDFLRDLGEKGVGGAEITKNVQNDESHLSSSKTISFTRRLNIARAYAWWIAKGCSSLTILKPVDFTVLQPQGREFFRALFFQLFVSSQVSSPAIGPNAEAAGYLTGSRVREGLEDVFNKATRISTLSQGLIYFLTTALRGDDGSNNELVSETLNWAREVAKETLRKRINIVLTS